MDGSYFSLRQEINSYVKSILSYQNNSYLPSSARSDIWVRAPPSGLSNSILNDISFIYFHKRMAYWFHNSQNLVSVIYTGFWEYGIYCLGLRLWTWFGLFSLGMSILRHVSCLEWVTLSTFFKQNFNLAKLKTFFFVNHFPLIIKPMWMLMELNPCVFHSLASIHQALFCNSTWRERSILGPFS